MSKTYTIEELEALSDARLNETAAELRGWHREPVGDSYSWLLAETAIMPCYRWSPATDRNQSGELLEWLTRRYWTVDVGFGLGNIAVIAMIDDGEFDKTIKIPGNTARSETIAFCAAMLAQQGRLKQ